MDAKQRQFLDGRIREYAKEQPEILKLRKVLLAIGGEAVVPPQEIDGDIPSLVESGFLMQYPVTLKRMEQHMCHLNTAKLFATGKATAFGTGFSLVGGLWRQHSWGLKRQKDGTNQILETTGKDDLYFGVLYWGVLGKMVTKGEFEFNGVTPPAGLVAELDKSENPEIEGAAVETGSVN
jgi:hypothetical protein